MSNISREWIKEFQTRQIKQNKEYRESLQKDDGRAIRRADIILEALKMGIKLIEKK